VNKNETSTRKSEVKVALTMWAFRSLALRFLSIACITRTRYFHEEAAKNFAGCAAGLDVEAAAESHFLSTVVLSSKALAFDIIMAFCVVALVRVGGATLDFKHKEINTRIPIIDIAIISPRSV
jgi:hypothetical protein